MKYTFLLPAYKGRFLDEMLRSIQSQTYKDFKVIISDDCSPEDLYGICMPYLDDSRFSYRRNEKNIGGKDLVAHWNLLVDMCDSEYLILASDDDVYSPRFLEEADALVTKYPQVDLIRAKVRNLDKYGRVCREEQPSNEFVDLLHFMEQRFCSEYYPCIANFIFKTIPFQAKGKFITFPLAMSSDDATTIMMASNGVANIQATTFDFRLSGINISYPKNESIEINLKKIEAANMFCNWMANFRRSLDTGYLQDNKLLSKIDKGISFYLYCCTSSYIYDLGYKNFIKEYKFIKHHNLFPNKKTMIRSYLKWWKKYFKTICKLSILTSCV